MYTFIAELDQHYLIVIGKLYRLFAVQVEFAVVVQGFDYFVVDLQGLLALELLEVYFVVLLV
jgi:hypothetical protein